MIVESVPDATELRDHWWWRPGWAPGARHLQWHLTFEGERGLQSLAAEVQRCLAPFPSLEPVPAPWLHLTLAGLGNVQDICDDRVREVINAAHARLADLLVIDLTFSHVVVFAESVVLVPDASDALATLRSALVGSASSVLGTPDVDQAFAPHVSVAYANGPASGAAVMAALHDVRSGPVTPVHPSLSLVELERDEREYRWRVVHAVPL
jgi:2'-5' RNA ligase